MNAALARSRGSLRIPVFGLVFVEKGADSTAPTSHGRIVSRRPVGAKTSYVSYRDRSTVLLFFRSNVTASATTESDPPNRPSISFNRCRIFQGPPPAWQPQSGGRRLPDCGLDLVACWRRCPRPGVCSAVVETVTRRVKSTGAPFDVDHLRTRLPAHRSASNISQANSPVPRYEQRPAVLPNVPILATHPRGRWVGSPKEHRPLPSVSTDPARRSLHLAGPSPHVAGGLVRRMARSPRRLPPPVEASHLNRNNRRSDLAVYCGSLLPIT